MSKSLVGILSEHYSSSLAVTHHIDGNRRDTGDPLKGTAAPTGCQDKLVLTEDMKLDAVVVTVAWVQEDEYLSAFARKVHITALQVNSRPPHSRRRGMWSWNNTHMVGMDLPTY